MSGYCATSVILIIAWWYLIATSTFPLTPQMFLLVVPVTLMQAVHANPLLLIERDACKLPNPFCPLITSIRQ